VIIVRLGQDICEQIYTAAANISDLTIIACENCQSVSEAEIRNEFLIV